MNHLTEMLNQSEALQQYSKPKQEILMRLAYMFQDNTHYLYLSPEELVSVTGIGTKEDWYELLNLQETKNYLKGTMAFLAQVAQRKTFASLVNLALTGGQGAQQAAKQIQELAGVMNQQDSNRVVVLHQIPRPQLTAKEGSLT